MTRVLVVDNDDSFVHTLVGYLGLLGAETEVVRNDAVAADGVRGLLADYDAVLLSPGPGRPSEAGISIPMVRAALVAGTPLLGVCLGHQVVAETFGASVSHAEELMHGKTSAIDHDGGRLFAGLRSGFTAARYHSLVIVPGTVPEEIIVTARTPDGTIMGIRHRSAPIEGVQFHPESVLTEGGHRLLANWLESAGLSGAVERADRLRPLVR